MSKWIALNDEDNTTVDFRKVAEFYQDRTDIHIVYFTTELDDRYARYDSEEDVDREIARIHEILEVEV